MKCLNLIECSIFRTMLTACQTQLPTHQSLCELNRVLRHKNTAKQYRKRQYFSITACSLFVVICRWIHVTVTLLLHG